MASLLVAKKGKLKAYWYEIYREIRIQHPTEKYIIGQYIVSKNLEDSEITIRAKTLAEAKKILDLLKLAYKRVK